MRLLLRFVRKAVGGKEVPIASAPKTDAASVNVPPFLSIYADRDLGMTRFLSTPSFVTGSIPGMRQKFGRTASESVAKMNLGEIHMMIEGGEINERLESSIEKIGKQFYGKHGEKFYDYVTHPEKDGELDARSLEAAQEIRTVMGEMREYVLNEKREAIRPLVKKQVEKQWRKDNKMTGKRISTEQREEISTLVDEAVVERIPNWGLDQYLPQIHRGNWRVLAEFADGSREYISSASTPFEAYTIAADKYFDMQSSGAEMPARFVTEGRAFRVADVVRVSRPRLFKIVNDLAKAAEDAVSPEAIQDALHGIIGSKEGKQKWAGFLKTRTGAPGFSKDLPLILGVHTQQFVRWKYLIPQAAMRGRIA